MKRDGLPPDPTYTKAPRKGERNTLATEKAPPVGFEPTAAGFEVHYSIH